MKKAILVLSSLLLFCCSTEKQNTTQNSFIINTVASKTMVNIDEEFTITLSSNENITGILYSYDNFVTESARYSNFGTSKALKFNFDRLGLNTIYLKAVNESNILSETKVIPITVTRGDAIKIKGLQVVSFYGINTSWDPEFPTTNPNHLADLQFGFSKIKIGNPFDYNYNSVIWYNSTVIENQGNMTWNCSNANLYLKPNATLKFGLADIDNGIAGADLLNGPPDYREISFSNYLVTKPTTITYTFPEINLEFIVTLEWAN